MTASEAKLRPSRPTSRSGGEARDAINRIGGTLPKQMLPAKHIKDVEKRLKSATPKLELDESDATGLLGDKNQKDDNL